jgi:ADP-ribose pyrophosphatase
MQPIGEREVVYRGKIIEVVQQKFQAGDEVKTFEVARRAPGTRLIIVSPDGKILITKEYRVEVKDYDYRLPGGKVFDSLEQYNEFLRSGASMTGAAELAARKEAVEECGIEVEEMEHVVTSKCGATMEWDLYYFLVKKYAPLAERHLEAGEDITVNWMSFEEVRELCLSGRMQEDRSVAVLLRWLNKSQ